MSLRRTTTFAKKDSDILAMINLALRQARRSGCRQRVGAVLTLGNRVLAASPNRRRNDPSVTFAHATFHAEEAVLRRTARTTGTTLYVARVDAADIPRLAKPCQRCEKALVEAGVARVHYTAEAQSVQVLKLI
ncbi:deaminase [Streptomyces collinus]|uniref:deaminase n=1 Tax=Streptomyces collinus TaxID=42684 RepID=UPI0036EA38F7